MRYALGMVMLPGSEPRSGNLTQELKAFLRCQITLLITLWLIFAAPITCQYHGLLPLTISSNYHLGHAMPEPTTDSDHALRQHETASSVTLSLFIMLLPGKLTVDPPEPKSEHVTIAPVAPQEWIAPPPHDPPRRLI